MRAKPIAPRSHYLKEEVNSTLRAADLESLFIVRFAKANDKDIPASAD
jgi:hypothetical protein